MLKNRPKSNVTSSYDPRFFNREKRSLRRLLWVSVVFVVMLFISVAGVSFLIQRIQNKSRSLVSSLEKAFGTQIIIGSKEFSLDHLILRDVVLKNHANTKIEVVRVDFGFFGSEGLGHIKKLSVKSSFLELNQSDLRKLSTLLPGKFENENHAHTNKAGLLTKLNRFIPQSLDIKIKRLKLRDVDLFTKDLLFDNFRSLGSRETDSYEVNVSRIASDRNILAENLSGKAYLDPKKNSWIFRLNRSESELDQSKQFYVNANYSLSRKNLRAQIRIKGFDLEIFKDISKFFPEASKSGLQTELFAKVLNQHAEIHASGKLEHFKIDHAAIAPHVTGPFNLNFSFSGLFDLEQNELSIRKAEIGVVNADLSHEPPINLSLTARASFADDFSLQNLTGTLDVENTPCTALARLDEMNLTPALSGFNIGGNFSARSKFEITPQSTEHTKIDLEKVQFACQLQTKTSEGPFAGLNTSRPIFTSFQRHSSYRPIKDTANFVRLANIPLSVQNIFLTSEDIGFYNHDGIDFKSVASALEKRIEDDRRTLGASTITMQVARNLFLSPERSLARKIQEIFLSRFLEDELQKDRILEIYFNAAEFGPGLYGIKNSAEHFFGKQPGDLSVLETVYLANLLPAPVKRYQYFCRNDLTPNFRELLEKKLGQLKDLQKIDEDTYLSAMHSQIKFNTAERNRSIHCKTYLEQRADRRNPNFSPSAL